MTLTVFRMELNIFLVHFLEPVTESRLLVCAFGNTVEEKGKTEARILCMWKRGYVLFKKCLKVMNEWLLYNSETAKRNALTLCKNFSEEISFYKWKLIIKLNSVILHYIPLFSLVTAHRVYISESVHLIPLCICLVYSTFPSLHPANTQQSWKMLKLSVGVSYSPFSLP